MKKKSSKGKPGVKRAKDLSPRNARSVQGGSGSLTSGILAGAAAAGGGGKAQGGPIMAGWDVKANVKA